MNVFVELLVGVEIIFFAANIKKTEKYQFFDESNAMIASWLIEEKAVCKWELVFVVVK